MYAADGVGLAACQIGVDRSVFVFDCPDDDGRAARGRGVQPGAVPARGQGPRLDDDDEGCLSLPGAFVGVRPPVYAEVEGQGLDGSPVRYAGTGLLARCLQHETDHCHGTVFGDRLNKRARKKLFKEADEVAADFPAGLAGLTVRPARPAPRHGHQSRLDLLDFSSWTRDATGDQTRHAAPVVHTSSGDPRDQIVARLRCAAERRRHALLGVLVVALLSGLVLTGRPGPATTRRRAPGSRRPPAAATKPNIVMVMADDMRTDDLRFMPVGAPAPGRHRAELPQLVQPLPAVLPGARVVPDRPLRAQPPRLLARDALRLPVLRRPRHARHRASTQSGYQTGFVGKYLNGYGAQHSLVTGGPSFRYVPAGWTDWYGAVERPAGSGYRSGGTYNYLHTLFNVNGRIDDTHAGQYQTDVLGRFARTMVHEVPPLAAAVLPLPLAPSPRTSGARARRATPCTCSAAAAGSRRSRPRPGRAGSAGTFDRQITRASGLPVGGGPSEADVSDKPRPMDSQPELSLEERYAEPEPDPAAGRGAVRPRPRGRPARGHAQAHRGVRRTPSSCSPPTTATSSASTGMRQGKIKPHEPSLRVPFVVAGRGVPHGRAVRPGDHARRHRDHRASSPARRPGCPTPRTASRSSRRSRPTAAGRSRSSPRAWSPAACSRCCRPRRPPASTTPATPSACGHRATSTSATPTATPRCTTSTATPTSWRA